MAGKKAGAAVDGELLSADLDAHIEGLFFAAGGTGGVSVRAGKVHFAAGAFVNFAAQAVKNLEPFFFDNPAVRIGKGPPAEGFAEFFTYKCGKKRPAVQRVVVDARHGAV